MAFHIAQDPAADAVLSESPFALLLGMLLDQQYKMEEAFKGGHKLLSRLGHLDPQRIAAMDPEEFKAIASQTPAIHRFPGSMATRVHALALHIRDEYGGHAEHVWTRAESSEELRASLSALPGFGEMKVKSLGAVLAKRFGIAAAQDLVPAHPTLGDVDSPEALSAYQAAKKAHKAEWSKSRVR